MPASHELNPIAYFKALHRGFSDGLARERGGTRLVDQLLEACFAAFDRACANAGLACHGGCASCCTIRVVATAPEILLIARAIRSRGANESLELRQRIVQSADATRSLGEQSRMGLGLPCPFVSEDLCMIYVVRPLACRGHASFDKQACADALAGIACDIPVSTAHLTARSMIQNAAQAALRDAGLSWGVYELNHALQIALTNAACEADWLRGEDVFCDALIEDVSAEEMAQTFDAIKALPG